MSKSLALAIRLLVTHEFALVNFVSRQCLTAKFSGDIPTLSSGRNILAFATGDICYATCI